MDYFISGEYTFEFDKTTEKTLDEKIMDKLRYCDINTQNKVLKMIDIL